MSRVVIFAAELGDMIAHTQSRADIRWGGSADCAALVAEGVNGYWLREVVEHAEPFVVAVEGGRVVGMNVFLTGDRARQQYSWLVLKLQPRDVLSLGGFVVPDRRGLGLIGEVKAFAARHFLARGYRRMVGVVGADNSASLKAFSRLGAKPLETLTRARIGRINLVWRSRALPRAFGRDRPLIVTL